MTTYPPFTQKKLVEPDQIKEKARQIKASGKKLVTINGSFDLMHAGHLHILYQGSLQGDVFWVLLNSDSSIRQYKSPLRPIINLENRITMMSSIEFVSHVSWFDELDPRRILSDIQPHIHVNGQEYGENCLEASTVKEHGGSIHIVPLVPGLSTSQIIKKIIETCA